jgi:hypothetical protein
MEKTDFATESAAIKKRFLEKLHAANWDLLQTHGEGDEKVEIFSQSFDDDPVPAFLSKFKLLKQNDVKKVFKLLHEFSGEACVRSGFLFF